MNQELQWPRYFQSLLFQCTNQLRTSSINNCEEKSSILGIKIRREDANYSSDYVSKMVISVLKPKLENLTHCYATYHFTASKMENRPRDQKNIYIYIFFFLMAIMGMWDSSNYDQKRWLAQHQINHPLAQKPNSYLHLEDGISLFLLFSICTSNVPLASA